MAKKCHVWSNLCAMKSCRGFVRFKHGSSAMFEDHCETATTVVFFQWKFTIFSNFYSFVQSTRLFQLRATFKVMQRKKERNCYLLWKPPKGSTTTECKYCDYACSQCYSHFFCDSNLCIYKKQILEFQCYYETLNRECVSAQINHFSWFERAAQTLSPNWFTILSLRTPVNIWHSCA